MPEFYLEQVPTCDLVNELAQREGVKEYTAPTREHTVLLWITNHGTGRIIRKEQTGPARILVVID